MQVDYISDLHIDMYIKNVKPIDKLIEMYHNIIAKDKKIGDILSIAGDLGHYNNQNINFLKYNVQCLINTMGYHTESRKGQLTKTQSFGI